MTRKTIIIQKKSVITAANSSRNSNRRECTFGLDVENILAVP
jgi:hypothetical protein